MISSSNIFNRKIMRVVLCGSYRPEFRATLLRAYHELLVCNCQILSPLQIDLDDDTFPRGTAEKNLIPVEVEKRHLTAIVASDFLYVNAPGGYIGLSTALEIGFAIANDIPIFSRDRILETPHCDFVTQVNSVYDALTIVGATLG